MHMNIQRGFPHTKYTDRLMLQSHPESTLGELKPKEFSLDLEGPNDCRMDSLFFGFIWQWFQWFFCSTNLISTYLYCNRLSSASTVLFYEPKRYKLWHKHKDYQPESIYLFRFFIECICVCVCVRCAFLIVTRELVQRAHDISSFSQPISNIFHGYAFYDSPMW